jgi:hypothetical protein
LIRRERREIGRKILSGARATNPAAVRQRQALPEANLESVLEARYSSVVNDVCTPGEYMRQDALQNTLINEVTAFKAIHD